MKEASLAVRGQLGRKRQVLMLLSNCFDPDPRVYAEARALMERGYVVSILAWDRDRKSTRREHVDGIDVERIFFRSTHGRGPSQAFFMALVLIALVWRGFFRSFDVVHAHDFDTLPAGIMLSFLRRKPLVFDAHEHYASMLHGSIPAWMERFLRWFEGRLLRYVDLVITVGEELRSDFEQRGARRCVVVGNWKRLEDFQPDARIRKQVRYELGVPEEALLIVHIGNLGRERRIPELLAAHAQRPDMHLLVGGEGPAADQVREATRHYPNLHYLGFVNHKNIARYTVASDVVYYGFDTNNPNARYSAPNKLFEALAAGCAVISGNFGEIGKIVRKSDCGILVEDFTPDQILRALDLCCEPARLDRWKRHAAEVGRAKYNWACAEQILINSYDQILRPGGMIARTGPAQAKQLPSS